MLLEDERGLVFFFLAQIQWNSQYPPDSSVALFHPASLRGWIVVLQTDQLIGQPLQPGVPHHKLKRAPFARGPEMCPECY